MHECRVVRVQHLEVTLVQHQSPLVTRQQLVLKPLPKHILVELIAVAGQMEFKLIRNLERPIALQAHISFLTYTNTKRETKETELMTENFFDVLGEKVSLPL